MLIAEGKQGSTAYQIAYPDSTPDAAKVSASRLLTNPNVWSRIGHLKGKITQGNVLSAIDRREWLAKLVTTPAEQIDGSSPLCNGLKPMKDGRMQVLIPDKLTALKLDALLSGDLAQANTQELKIGIFQAGDGTVAVQIG